MKALDTAHRELVDGNLNYVRALAARHYSCWADVAEYDDLVSYGCEGLLAAARRFRGDGGSRFSTFAFYRIHGAIMDGAHRMKNLPRHEEILGGDEFEADSPVEAALHVVTERAETLDEMYDRNRRRHAMQRALACLPDASRRLMELRYFEDLTLEEAGKRLGISKSWASRIHAQALKLLREALSDK